MNFSKYVALVSDGVLGFKLPLVSVNVKFDTIQCYFSCVTENKYSSGKSPKFLLENGVSNIIPEAHVLVGHDY